MSMEILDIIDIVVIVFVVKQVISWIVRKGTTRMVSIVLRYDSYLRSGGWVKAIEYASLYIYIYIYIYSV
jgi:hypothetical protein